MISLCTDKWQIDNIDTVLFDKDGTFIDLHYFEGKMTELRAQEVINRFALPQESCDRLCLYLGYNKNTQKMLKDGITALYSRPKIIEIFTENLEELGIKTNQTEIEKIFDSVSNNFYTEMNKYTKPIEEAVSFIKKLYSLNIKLGVVTSDSVESTKLTLAHYGWDKYFKAVIGRESTKENKESGVPVTLALKTLDSNQKNTVMIGDAPMDYFAAANAGVDNTILVSTGQIEVCELIQHSDFAVKSLNEIKIKT